MDCHCPLQWLNDEVINLYMSLLLERDAQRRMQVRMASGAAAAPAAIASSCNLSCVAASRCMLL